ncbi:hypothetical protein P154DRAFT_611454 [Amniculicola lignicola CBS 123094]|uniref:BTB domain-containing protein n=1 Tax=Amniculicola lignicola CBS 123094 TaxID=1392246 RepID=A0A6A5W1X3_9PLEO|nr:hypothetical protein P154DRAFT_611454 [Amniculicola lignicola CBS 123094]
MDSQSSDEPGDTAATNPAAESLSSSHDWQSLDNLLNLALRRPCQSSIPRPSTHLSKHGHTVFSLRPLGCDFTLETAHGIQYQIHSAWILGGPLALQEFIFSEPHPLPGQDFQSSTANQITFPIRIPTVCIDRLVEHIYIKTYRLDAGGKATKVHRATFGPYPEPKSPVDTVAKLMSGLWFHLKMFALAEELKYEALKETAVSKVIELTFLMGPHSVSALKELIRLAYAKSEEARIVKGQEDVFRRVLVAAVLRHMATSWKNAGMDKVMKKLGDTEEAAAFWVDLEKGRARAEELKVEPEKARLEKEKMKNKRKMP